MDTVQSLHSVSIGQANVCWFWNILAYLYDHLTGGMTDC